MDGVFQLTDIARPAVLQQGLARAAAQAHALQVQAAAVDRQEMLGQGDDVAGALRQRRQGQHRHIEPVVQVGAEVAGGHGLLQLHVGGGHQAHIDIDGAA